MKTIKTIEFDATLDGHDVLITFERTSTWSYENYGADADGNRGMMMLTLDVDDYADITVTPYADDGSVVTTSHTGLPEVQRVAVEALVEAWMQAHEPEPDEPSEPDYDDVGD